MCEAYDWLRSNYVPGDEVFLFGFSEGAHTARAIGGLITRIGYISKTADLQDLYKDYKDYRTIPSPSTSLIAARQYKVDGAPLGPIKVIGVWESMAAKSHSIHDTKISPSGFLPLGLAHIFNTMSNARRRCV